MFLLQPADNKEVAETLIESIDTSAMTKFIDGLLKFKTRYAYTKTATKGTFMFLLVQFTDKIYHLVCLMFRIFFHSRDTVRIPHLGGPAASLYSTAPCTGYSF